MMSSDGDDFSCYLLAICICSWGKCLLKFFAYSNYLNLFILLFSFRRSLYILDMYPLSDKQLADIFSHYVGCLFTLLIFSFAVQNIFSLMKSHLCIFVLLLVLLTTCPRNHCQDQFYEVCFLCFILTILWYQVLCLSL